MPMRRRYGTMPSAPRPQFNPMESGCVCITLTANASTVWPESVRPEASLTVMENMTSIGLRSAALSPALAARSSITLVNALAAAFAFKVSKIVSIRIASTPSSTSTWICSR